ncbi:hypothetical protein A2165_02645 [Candidatus Curtissbacteria bacterium RBG_13_40_7]|uniref:Glycosyltransferase RgtA/B/C/D-like domain-containing protein n=1 Tax=Candidatus Curtissbacteria bacterium RBG_13_40_7 TaxID=1797706 RepID=A0A1F5FV80_9BACT|nr:MAG: hypothetical protein A2165_02645 [Candidatus Curtissbacteria bacterium RBG_13_40_7]
MSRLEKILLGANRQLIPILIIVLIGTLLRLNKINQAFPFDHDQEVPAIAAYDFFVNHKITLVGQELSFQGFFLGPIHNWIQFIPYGSCGLKPDCVPYFYLLLGILTVVVFYLIAKIIFDTKTAIIACAIYAISFSAISFERGVNSNFFLFLSSIGLLFCLYKYFSGKDKFLILGAFIAGLALVNFNPVFIFSSLAFFLTALIRSKRSLIVYIISGIALLINYLPLVFFNFRHENILVNNFIIFVKQNSQTSDYLPKSVFLLKNVSIPFFADYLFQSGALIFSLITLILLGSGIILNLKRKNAFNIFLPIWILVTFLGFIFYRGWIPNYYFQQVLLPAILLVSICIRKNFAIFLIFSAIFLFTNISRNINYNSRINYEAKKRVTEFIINNTVNETYKVFNNLPISQNTGYPTLFKLFGKSPQEDGENLFILESTPPAYFLELKYRQVFPEKQVSVDTISFTHIISVK